MKPGRKLRLLDLFSGIGGFSLGMEGTGGFETVGFCEIDKNARAVLAKHWPEVPCFEDVEKLTARSVRDACGDVDILTAGFPCQDISAAGRQAGIGEGTRSGLWSEVARLIGELRPRYAVMENVAALLQGPSGRPGRWFSRILWDLAACGYDAEWENIPAAAVGAPHRRERIWIVAYPMQVGRAQPHVLARCRLSESDRVWPAVEHGLDIDLGERGTFRFPSDLCVGNGISSELGCYGNAVVPQIPEMIGAAILEIEQAREASI